MPLGFDVGGRWVDKFDQLKVSPGSRARRSFNRRGTEARCTLVKWLTGKIDLEGGSESSACLLQARLLAGI